MDVIEVVLIYCCIVWIKCWYNRPRWIS